MDPVTDRLGPNDLAPCPSDSARRRHLAKAETCPVCEIGVGYEPLPDAREEVTW